jgi:hypothetical protein
MFKCQLSIVKSFGTFFFFKIETKTTNEVVEFYYHWKLSGHYQMFKYHGRPWSTNRRTACNKKVEQWKETNKVMKEFDGKS